MWNQTETSNQTQSHKHLAESVVCTSFECVLNISNQQKHPRELDRSIIVDIRSRGFLTHLRQKVNDVNRFIPYFRDAVGLDDFELEPTRRGGTHLGPRRSRNGASGRNEKARWVSGH